MIRRPSHDPSQAAAFMRQLQRGQARGLRLRRAVAAVSLIGMASMAAVSLYQLGLVRHLPDPPWRRFDSDAVTASDTAYQHGVRRARSRSRPRAARGTRQPSHLP